MTAGDGCVLVSVAAARRKGLKLLMQRLSAVSKDKIRPLPHLSVFFLLPMFIILASAVLELIFRLPNQEVKEHFKIDSLWDCLPSQICINLFLVIATTTPPHHQHLFPYHLLQSDHELVGIQHQPLYQCSRRFLQYLPYVFSVDLAFTLP